MAGPAASLARQAVEAAGRCSVLRKPGAEAPQHTGLYRLGHKQLPASMTHSRSAWPGTTRPLAAQ